MADGLRARKKQRTRQALSDAATALFAERGFDAVTTAEIAAAAEVAVGTVFNYFGSKEELFFDRAEAMADDLAATIAVRPAGVGFAGAFRQWHEREVGFLLDPRGAEVTLRFFRTIAASPTLQAAEHRLYRRLESALAGVPAVLAALLLAIHRVVVDEVRALTLGEVPPDERRGRVARTVERAFAALSDGALAEGVRPDGEGALAEGVRPGGEGVRPGGEGVRPGGEGARSEGAR